MNIKLLIKQVAVLAVVTMVGAVAVHAQVKIDYVTVGYPGEGWVDYVYEIGEFEVTNAQYSVFLNAVAKCDPHGLYNLAMGSTYCGGITRTGPSGHYRYATKCGYENKPVVFVSFFDAVRFANWLNNGQGKGSTETGAYSIGTAGYIVTRNADARVVVPSRAEWFKAAYFDPTLLSGFWTFATRSSTLGDNTDFWATNGANYSDGNSPNPNGGCLTDVGSYVNATSFFGTYDQAGNVAEWNDDLIESTLVGRNFRPLLGGSFLSGAYFLASYSEHNYNAPIQEDSGFGFRVARLKGAPKGHCCWKLKRKEQALHFPAHGPK